MAANANSPARGPNRRLRGLRDIRIRAKLGLILIIPLVATVGLAAARLAEGGGRAVEAELVRSQAAVSVETATVSHELHRERIQAVRLLADPGGEASGFHRQSSRTDDAVAAYQVARSALGQVPDLVGQRLAVVDQQLVAREELRREVLSEPTLTPPAVTLRYGAIIADLLAYQEAVGGVVTDPVLSEEIRAVAALSRAKAHAADAQAFAQVVAAGEPLPDEQLGAFLATRTGQREAFMAFQQVASPRQQATADRVITGGAVAFTESGTSALLASAADGQAAPATSFAGVVSAARWVEEQLLDELLASATQTREAVFRRVLLESAAVVLALAVAVTVAVLLARMLARSLVQLRQHALLVANQELPATVARLADPSTLGEHTPARLAAQVREPAQLRSRDEIGQVAQSFTVVHRAAVRVAAEQAALRTSVSAMFLNLARRSQALVDRMIKQLDRIERTEEDPQRLAQMFALDHLAIRMRRNDENLLTLAGADSSPPRRGDALLADVLRAAQGEVEQYHRIEFGTVDSDVSVLARAVNDVARLMAELFDNAVRFSAPEVPVLCEARRLGDQVIVQIEDRGVGMVPHQLEQLNSWLAAPPALEVTTFRRMGLAVVARLAARYGIRVELRSQVAGSGTIAYVALPRAILVLPLSRLHAFDLAATAVASGPPAPAPVAAAQAPTLAHRPGQVPRRPATVASHRAGRSAAAPAGGPPPATSTVELPIFQEMRAAWFPDEAAADTWRTAADEGWRAAAAAAHPTPAGATASGLPRRMPRAQLVPGGVGATSPPVPRRQRNPDEVRGLLGAYQRGVQRGRRNGSR